MDGSKNVEARRCALCGDAREPAETPETASARAGLGRLLGPLSDRMGVTAVWVHQECAVWSPEVFFIGVGCLKNVKAALRRGKFLKCSRCGQPGATIGCRVARCPRTYHLPCARLSGCSFNPKRYLMSCAEHVHMFLREQRERQIECMIGVRDDPMTKKNLKDRKEDKVDNAEDEEFQKRERKRLQRDLARLAPVKLGGGLSQGKYEGWESIGGLQNVAQCLKEMVTLPLLYPDVFQNMGIVPPRGVLLHGYPGTGKTLVVRALLGACSRGDQKIAYFSRKGADCLGKYVGDSERQLRLLFQLAEQSQPSIIFFDEIDGLAPKRSRNQDQTIGSVVSTLLALMDGLNPRGSVVVIGATNRPDALDPALRRAGRFDREIFFPLPSAADREAILGVHTKSWKRRPSPELLAMISKSTVGYAGADLQAVCAQAAMIALRKRVCVQDLLSAHRGKDYCPEIQVQPSDWFTALARSGPPCSRRMIGSALSEVHISPLPYYFVHVLLRPVLKVFLHLDSDGRFTLPSQLKKPLTLAREKKYCEGTRRTAAQVDVENACRGTGIFSEDEMKADEENSYTHVAMKPLVDGWRLGSFRILLAGSQKDGKSLVAASVLHVLQSYMQVFVLSTQTMIQAGSGDLCDGLIQIVDSARSVSSVVYMPRIDSWALEKAEQDSDRDQRSHIVSSKAWGNFLQQTSVVPSNLPRLYLATCEEPELPLDIQGFFYDAQAEPKSKARYGPRACVQVPKPKESDIKEVFKRASTSFTSLVRTTKQASAEAEEDFLPPSPAEPNASSTTSQPQPQEAAASQPQTQDAKPRSALADSIRQCGYQLLNSPHFMAVRQATGRLTSGPSLFLEDSYTGLWVIKDITAKPVVEEANGIQNAQSATELDDKKEEKMQTETHQPTVSNRILEALGPETADDLDEDRRIWGLEAVGMKAWKGFYETTLDMVSDSKTIVQLLREKYEKKKSKAPRSRWRRRQLLTQAAALQDLMDSWAHEMRRLESREKKSSQQTVQQPSVYKSAEEQQTCVEVRPTKRRKVEKWPEVLDHPSKVENVFLAAWEKHGRSFMIEDIHDIISETSAQLFSRQNEEVE